ncbi:ABC-type transport system ATP-binding protein (probable substrate dipeptide/oligopeptide) [Halobacterium hubeiense]|jgi:peptide/nickel transport system ATP-binding protein|uniref:Nickel import system ATP-binding protein NikD n=2 Tax=Halobacterium TaxID=2239 RepID=A0A0U5D0T5_9EURY|nr:ABC transporter ATP-binding protein [Halobacterium hubeiense]CQH61718.1 ABC-type transport system ATP-binding protein (probable substrate dipeptide/oligopeptide) [Halobacterium hubeiense]
MNSDTMTTPTDADDRETLLSVSNLRTSFYTDKEVIRAVDGVDFEIRAGETVGIVGESGSGKSVTARSIMGLVESPGRIEPDSSIQYRGNELTTNSESEWQDIRGGDIAMVFQDPLTSLNPVYTVGNQIKEALRLHQNLRGSEATKEATRLLQEVGIPDAPRRLREYPHQFSGGMRQRAVIAMALACDPSVLICDEPTTALDVTIQAQILELLDKIQEEEGIGIMFITHDMGVIAEVSDRVNVMYAGEFVESAPVEDLFENPKHPYTQGLLESIPSKNAGKRRLDTIEGEVPTPTDDPTYCRFAPRCPKAFDECEVVHPESVQVQSDVDHSAACLLYPDEQSTEERVTTHQAAGDDAAETGESQ